MIKVAFIISGSQEWMGAINYLSNLLYAISKLENKKIETVVFMGTKTDSAIFEKFSPHAQIVHDTLLDRKSIKWFLSKIFEKIFNSYIFKKKLLDKYNITVISHSDINFDTTKLIKINWIPDFQHLHLPELFSEKELKRRNTSFLEYLRLSDAVIVSSYDAYDDCKKFAPKFIDKVKILQFVSQPSYKKSTPNKKSILEKKFNYTGSFFYLPNQFWKHKNHLVVFEAIKLLKAQGIEVLVLCSGYMKDYRHPNYIQEIKIFIQQFNLEDNIKILGLIEYDEVIDLMRYSVAVINPSLFEGWSSTVEECKSIGKKILLSDIAIHREQNPPGGLYFDPYNVLELSELLKDRLNFSSSIENKNMEKIAKNKLIERTFNFATTYQNIILQLYENKTNKHK